MSQRSDLNEMDTLTADLERARAQQTATHEILACISRSRDDEAPVFEVILENAARLCRAPHAGLLLRDADDRHLTLVAMNADWSGYADYIRAHPHALDDETSLTAEAVHSMQVRQYPDIEALAGGTEISDQLRNTWKLERMRTLLYVPLISGDRAIGTLGLYRLHVEEFSDEDIEILKIFAAQAVIAIENVQQFRDVRRRLERETATKNILAVISQSSDDESPVFDTILVNATRLCNAPIAGLCLVDKDREKYELVASRGANPEFVDALRDNPPDLDPERFAAARAIVEQRVVHVEDLASPTLYGAKESHRISTIKTEGTRTALFVPLIWDGQSIGAIGLWRREVKPFHAEEIALVETFAVQAVIAIENVRQFNALENLNADLSERVEEQVTEIERMGRLKRFLPSAVADAVVSAGDESMLSSHRALIATLFCDMRGFTAFCEAAEPEETIEVLQTYHQQMSELIDQHGGGVDQRAGDGIMVIFNDPIPVDDPAGDAVRLALAMRGRMRELCTTWKKLGHRLGFGIGISFGYATVGIVGSTGRFDYTASGTSVNTAARLCDMAANDEILISPRTRTALEGVFEAESRGEVEMKGIREPVEVFAIVSE